MVLIQSRDHSQKGKKFHRLIYFLDQFRKLFKVLDAHRVKKSGMKEMLNTDKFEQYIQKYGLYQIAL